MDAAVARWLAAVACSAGLATGGLARAAALDGLRGTSEFQVNTSTTYDQQCVATAALASGDFVVVWDSPGPQSYTVQARRVSAEGVPLGAQFQVESFTTGNQTIGDVEGLPSGGFVVAWSSVPLALDAPNRTGTRARRFDVDARPVGLDFQVATDTSENQENVQLAVHPDGSTFFAWYGLGAFASDIFGRAWDAGGLPLGPQQMVNEATAGTQILPHVTATPDGFAVVWRSTFPPEDDESWQIRGRLFGTAGSPLGSEFRVDTSDTADPERVPVAGSFADGTLLTVWNSTPGPADPTMAVVASSRSADGEPTAAEFQVNAYTTGLQWRPALATSPSRRAVVVWESGATTDPDGSVTARLVEPGRTLGPELVVNGYTTGVQGLPDVAWNRRGQILVVWQSHGSLGSDTDGLSIQARTFTDPWFVFADDFESGDASEWDAIWSEARSDGGTPIAH